MNFIDIILKLYIGHKYNTFIIRGTAGNFQSEKKTKQPSEMMLNPLTHFKVIGMRSFIYIYIYTITNTYIIYNYICYNPNKSNPYTRYSSEH